MFDRIDHVGIAVKDIDDSLVLWRDGFGMAVSHREVIGEQGVEAALLDVGENHVELLAPLGEDTPVGKFLAKRGPGLHHVAYQVADIDKALDSLKQAGVRADRRAAADRHPQFAGRLPDPRGAERVLVEVVGAGADATDGTTPARRRLSIGFKGGQVVSVTCQGRKLLALGALAGPGGLARARDRRRPRAP